MFTEIKTNYYATFQMRSDDGAEIQFYFNDAGSLRVINFLGVDFDTDTMQELASVYVKYKGEFVAVSDFDLDAAQAFEEREAAGKEQAAHIRAYSKPSM